MNVSDMGRRQPSRVLLSGTAVPCDLASCQKALMFEEFPALAKSEPIAFGFLSAKNSRSPLPLNTGISDNRPPTNASFFNKRRKATKKQRKILVPLNPVDRSLPILRDISGETAHSLDIRATESSWCQNGMRASQPIRSSTTTDSSPSVRTDDEGFVDEILEVIPAPTSALGSMTCGSDPSFEQCLRAQEMNDCNRSRVWKENLPPTYRSAPTSNRSSEDSVLDNSSIVFGSPDMPAVWNMVPSRNPADPLTEVMKEDMSEKFGSSVSVSDFVRANGGVDADEDDMEGTDLLHLISNSLDRFNAIVHPSDLSSSASGGSTDVPLSSDDSLADMASSGFGSLEQPLNRFGLDELMATKCSVDEFPDMFVGAIPAKQIPRNFVLDQSSAESKASITEAHASQRVSLSPKGNFTSSNDDVNVHRRVGDANWFRLKPTNSWDVSEHMIVGKAVEPLNKPVSCKLPFGYPLLASCFEALTEFNQSPTWNLRTSVSHQLHPVPDHQSFTSAVPSGRHSVLASCLLMDESNMFDKNWDLSDFESKLNNSACGSPLTSFQGTSNPVGLRFQNVIASEDSDRTRQLRCHPVGVLNNPCISPPNQSSTQLPQMPASSTPGTPQPNLLHIPSSSSNSVIASSYLIPTLTNPPFPLTSTTCTFNQATSFPFNQRSLSGLSNNYTKENLRSTGSHRRHLNSGGHFDRTLESPLRHSRQSSASNNRLGTRSTGASPPHLMGQRLSTSALNKSVSRNKETVHETSGELNISAKPAVAKWRRACSFYLRGHCKKEDCEFAHDLTKVTCKFWETGECFKGSTCPFLHGYPPELTAPK